MFFENRKDAGQKLAEVVGRSIKDIQNFEVVGIARGGVIVAGEIAKSFGLPMQAICEGEVVSQSGGEHVHLTSLGSGLHHKKGRTSFIRDLQVSKNIQIQLALRKARERQLSYNNGQQFVLTRPNVLVCDDGLVSGESAITVLKSIKLLNHGEVVLAVPVIPGWLTGQVLESFRIITWRRSTIQHPSTGIFYYEFNDTPDEDVCSAVRSCQVAKMAHA